MLGSSLANAKLGGASVAISMVGWRDPIPISKRKPTPPILVEYPPESVQPSSLSSSIESSPPKKKRSASTLAVSEESWSEDEEPMSLSTKSMSSIEYSAETMTEEEEDDCFAQYYGVIKATKEQAEAMINHGEFYEWCFITFNSITYTNYIHLLLEKLSLTARKRGL